MSQGDLVTPSGSGLAVRTGINAAIDRLATKGAGTARPSDIATYETWLETDNPGAGIGSLWLWDGTSDILIGLVNTSTHAFVNGGSITSAALDALLGSTKGMIAARGASAWAGKALGSALHHLRMNAAADDVEYFQAPAVISDQVLAAASSVSFQNIPTGYKNLSLHYELFPGTNAINILGRVFQSNVEDTGTNYSWAYLNGNASGASGAAGASAQTSFLVGLSVRNTADLGGISGVIDFPNYQAARYTRAIQRFGWVDSTGGNYNTATAVGAHTVVGPIDGVKLFLSSGTFSGRATLVGW